MEDHLLSYGINISTIILLNLIVCLIFICALLLPAPKLLHRVLLSLLGKLNSRVLYGPSRIFYAFLAYSFVGALSFLVPELMRLSLIAFLFFSEEEVDDAVEKQILF